LFRSFLPLQNPVGFGGADFIELAWALLLVLMVATWPRLQPYAIRFAERTGWCMCFLAILPVALRLILVPHHPIPAPNVSDDFSYVLVADTLRHFRLANPPHPLPQFFETFFALQDPTYSSIFPIGQGIAIALGWTLFGHPWAGVALSIGAFCGLCYWMLRAWVPPGWALLGGVLAAIEFGPLSQWMNSFWGGGVSATAGCLVYGALPRIREAGKPRDAILLGLGLGLQILTRPFESVFLTLSIVLYFLPSLRVTADLRALAKPAAIAAITVLPAIALVLLHNREVTRSWTTLPYMVSRYQYGVPATFTFQPNPVPHRELTPEQKLDFDIQAEVHGKGPDSIGSYLSRIAYRVRFYRFFFLAPLYLAIPFFLLRLREFRYVWVALTLAVFAAGTNFYPYFYSHYIAAATCLFVLVSVAGLERLSRLALRGVAVGRSAAALIVFLCATNFLFWYGLHVFEGDLTEAMVRYEPWDVINRGDPDGRIAVNDALAKAPGQQLVFIRYWPQHRFEEWVHNAADIDGSRVVWAHDLGTAENEKLLRYYRNRTAWLLEPDAHRPKLVLYPPESGAVTSAPTPAH
jgi:hypothetical protein